MPEGKSTVKTCGSCDTWRETKDQCPGCGYCTHPLAQNTKLGPDRVSVSCRLLPFGNACLIGHK